MDPDLASPSPLAVVVASITRSPTLISPPPVSPLTGCPETGGRLTSAVGGVLDASRPSTRLKRVVTPPPTFLCPVRSRHLPPPPSPRGPRVSAERTPCPVLKGGSRTRETLRLLSVPTKGVLCVHVHVSICVCLPVPVCGYMCTYVCKDVYICTWVQVCVRVRRCPHVRGHKCTYVCECVRVSVCVVR